jgi:hypothetical protein
MGGGTLTEGTTSQVVLSGCELTGYTISEIVNVIANSIVPSLER